MSANVSIEEVERVAELANLDLADDEKPRMQRDLNAILEYVAQVSDLIESDEDSIEQFGHGEALRADGLRPSLDRATVMHEAPETDGAFFKTPKVIER
jgi:aspartyl-tRNA(Asn)/glutamyl-tRNA(Gln) amidotransferase subunit C